MKKIITTTLFLFVSMALLQAQDMRKKGQRKMMHQKHERMKEGKNKMMKSDIHLSETQQAQAKANNEEFKNKMMELKKNDNITMKDFRTKMETLKKDHKTKMESILTTDQKNTIAEKKKTAMAIKKIDAKAKMEKMKVVLNLSDDQSAKIAKLQADRDAKFKALKENTSLSDEKKKEQAKLIMEKQKTEMQTILNAEQKQKLEKMRHNRTGHSK